MSENSDSTGDNSESRTAAGFTCAPCLGNFPWSTRAFCRVTGNPDSVTQRLPERGMSFADQKPLAYPTQAPPEPFAATPC